MIPLISLLVISAAGYFLPAAMYKSFEKDFGNDKGKARTPAVKDSVIVDSFYSLNQALNGKQIPGYIRKDLRIVNVFYYSFDGKIHEGQVVIHKNLVADIKKIFALMRKEKFPVAKAIPAVKYGWSDKLSMLDNNTSAFNYRDVKGTRLLSAHAAGRAIDINPFLNPQIKHNKEFPAGASYNPAKPGTITRNSFLVKAFLKMGWQWGGSWTTTKDYQHFEKR